MPYLSNTRQLTIEWGHCDPAGIVFNSHYFEYFDFSTILLFEKALGMKKIDMMKTFDADMPLVDARAKFLLPAKFGDVVEITSEIAEFRRSSFRVQHRLTNHGRLAVEGQETRVWVGHDPDDPVLMKSKPIPDEIISRFNTA
jgi:4-hydroxybenzoyl-CoA thioesterase